MSDLFPLPMPWALFAAICYAFVAYFAEERWLRDGVRPVVAWWASLYWPITTPLAWCWAFFDRHTAATSAR